jgi:hypothetical protein
MNKRTFTPLSSPASASWTARRPYPVGRGTGQANVFHFIFGRRTLRFQFIFMTIWNGLRDPMSSDPCSRNYGPQFPVIIGQGNATASIRSTRNHRWLDHANAILIKFDPKHHFLPSQTEATTTDFPKTQNSQKYNRGMNHNGFQPTARKDRIFYPFKSRTTLKTREFKRHPP